MFLIQRIAILCLTGWLCISSAMSQVIAPETSFRRYLPAFTGIETKDFIDVYITQGDSEMVKIEGQPSDLQFVQTDVIGGTLVIGWAFKNPLKSFEHVKVYVTCRQINNLRVSGTGTVTSITPIVTPGFQVYVTGSGLVSMQLECDSINAFVNSGAELILAGTARRLVCYNGGSGSIRAFQMEAEHVVAENKGIGVCEVHPVYTLSAIASGAGKIYYTGEPKITGLVTKGLGKVIKR